MGLRHGFSVAMVSAVMMAAAPSHAQTGDNAPAALELAASPAAFFKRAASLWARGEREDAVFWLYAGQLRYRTYLAARPDLDPSGQPALFASLMESVGRPINEYAFGSVPNLTATIDRVLAWDKANSDPALPAALHEKTRAGLMRLRDQIRRDAATIRAQRTSNGLENR